MLVYGVFEASLRYVVFFGGSFLFSLALLTAFTFFNPFSLELRYVGSDIAGTVRWLRGLDVYELPQQRQVQQPQLQQGQQGQAIPARTGGHGGTQQPRPLPPAPGPVAVTAAAQVQPTQPAIVKATPENSWTAYYEQHCAEFDRLPLWGRIYMSLRLCRWVVLAAALLYSAAIVNVSDDGVSQGIFLGAMFLVPALFIAVLQLLHVATTRCCPRPLRMQWGEGGRVPTWVPTRQPLLRALQGLVLAGVVTAAVLLIVFGSTKSTLDAGDVIELVMVFLIMVSQVCTPETL